MTVYLEDKRADFAGLAGKIQHLCGGFPLLAFGVEKLRAGEEIPIALLEIAIAAIVLIAFAIELRALRRKLQSAGAHHEHAFVGWFDLAAGILLIFEAVHGARHKPFYLRPQFLSGIVTLALGFFHARLHGIRKRRRYLTIDENGIDCRTARLRRFRISWDDLASIRLEPHRAVFERKDGGAHTLNLRALHNRETVRDAIQGNPRSAPLLRA